MYRFVLLGLLLLLPHPSFADFTSAAAAVRRGDHAAAYEACKGEIEKDPECQNLVGVLFQKGLGVAANPAEALRLFRRAADRKLAAAQVNLGLANLNGIGVPKDEAFAARWFAEAAKQGDVVGEFHYGTMLISGKGGEKDAEKGIEYLKHGADRGYAPAQVSLALVHELKRQPATAYVWYRVAARTAADPEQRRFANLGEQRTLLSLSGQQIPLVRTAADHWKPTGPALEFGLLGVRPVASDANGKSDPNKPHSAGSGFIANKAGDVITNNHVIDGCREIKVVHGAKPVTAKLIGTDLAADVALIRTSEAADSAAIFRDTPVKAGEPVLVIGYPLGGALSSEASVTSGIISATAGPHDDKKMVQITAPVQQGNSGGPLLDSAGMVVGVVRSKINAIRVAQITGALPENINFAVNGQMARDLLDKNAVTYQKASAGEPVNTQTATERAMKYTVMIQCFK